MNRQEGALRSPVAVQEMFDRIVPRYDLMNRIMTGGRDVAWRGEAAQIVSSGGAQRVLDVATGTGDLAFAVAACGVPEVIGVDFSAEMISAAERKNPNPDQVRFMAGNALQLPFPDASFDGCTVGFGLRNMERYVEALKEMTRVLRPGGVFVCLEATPFRYRSLRGPFNLYFTKVLPAVGGLVSGDYDAYRYLPQSVAAFPDAFQLAQYLYDADLWNIRWKYFGAGTVALHTGVKRSNGQ